MRDLIGALLFSFAVACTQTPDAAEPIAPKLQGNGQGPDVNPDAPVPASSPECKFKAGEECFANAKAACKAAGCEESSCIQKETSPVQVSCQR